MTETGSRTAAPLGAAVLDIGGDVGAVVVHLATPIEGELYACPRGASDRHFHTGVHERDVADGTALVAIFPEVGAGDYSLLDRATGTEHTPFTVIGGQVTMLEL